SSAVVPRSGRSRRSRPRPRRWRPVRHHDSRAGDPGRSRRLDHRGARWEAPLPVQAGHLRGDVRACRGRVMTGAETKAEAKKWLSRRETHAHHLLDPTELMNLSDAALAAAERRLTSLTTTNCGWAIYEVRDVLLNDIRREKALRKAGAELAA